MMARWFVLLAMLLVTTPLGAQTALPPAPYANRQLDDPKLEAKAHELMLTIRCLTCQSQSIADSNASMAADMRTQSQAGIAHGEDPEAIRVWLIERYGDWVSYRPTAAPILWPLWAAPVLMLAAGVALVTARIRRNRGER